VIVPDERSVTYPPIERLVPHGAPMRALERLVQWAPGHALCDLHVAASLPFVEEGRLPSVVTLEYMAQAVAACLGHEAYVGTGTEVRVGMLIGIRQMKLLRPHVLVGDRLEVEVDRIRGNEDVSTFRGETRVGEVLVTTAHMTVFHGAQPPEA
jgi:predicted hotdog family 3-hydroxylacyl-ACP dehydratase